jgi:hypothetical protein
MKKQYQKIVLLLDNPTSHSVKKVMSNVTVKFLALNLTSPTFRRGSHTCCQMAITSKFCSALSQSQKLITQSLILRNQYQCYT